jgi:N-acetylglucosaminyl-diphospho-decaprenol L-rhamnosyltransferase
MTRTSPTPIDVVVVSYNSRDTLRACVEPLTRVPGVTVYAVDNHSPDRSLDVVADLPVEAVQTGRNGGFAFGCNAGLRLGTAPYVLFLNPDAWIDPADLQTLATVLETEPGVGLVGPRLLDGDDELIRSLRRFPTLATTWSEALFLHRLVPRAPWAGEVVHDDDAYERPAYPDWVSGAAMLARREILESIGGLDEGFFLYSEDTDLCARVHAAGYSIRYEPGATVRHHGGHSAPRSSLLPVLAVSRARYAAKHLGVLAAIGQRLALLVHSATHAAVAVRRLEVARGHSRAFRRLLGRAASADE